MPRTTPAFLLAAMVSAVALTQGCVMHGRTPGGNLRSNDVHTYLSTPEQPMTVSLVDTRDGAAVWSYDIPVGKKLSLEFHSDRSEDATLPDKMMWELMEPDEHSMRMRSEIAVPPAQSRRLEVSLRDSMEAPEGFRSLSSD